MSSRGLSRRATRSSFTAGAAADRQAKTLTNGGAALSSPPTPTVGKDHLFPKIIRFVGLLQLFFKAQFKFKVPEGRRKI
jgi:hypothetical protein